MTLSRFLRDYLYIPLGGSRCGPFRRQANLMVTMLLGGLWHGAGWTFIIWGILHGAYLVINHLWQKLLGDRLAGLPKIVLKAGRLSGLCLTFACVVVAWVFFRAESVPAAMAMLEGMLGSNGLGTVGEHFRGSSEIKFLLICALIVWWGPNVQEIMQRFRPALETYDQHRLATKSLIWSPSGRWALIIGLLGSIAVMNMTGVSEFLYFQF
jgi:D-alanyl-lipoteichoic acid acyltransferase DltB (MBOAT superfamily)